jgi:exodeoxyribonuclease VII large subunit
VDSPSSSPSYSVSELTAEIKTCLRNNFDFLRVRGEIADFTHYQASGHMYFSLADDEATLSAVMFRRANEKLEFEPEEGTTVVAEGRLDVYEERGNYQLIVEDMQAEGAGALEQEFEELKHKLEEEGVLDRDRKRSLPELPETIGVVTSGDGAAFWDIARTLQRRCPIVRIVLYPSRVNGRDSSEDIVRGIERLPEIVDLDLLIVGRGGGSPEDLWGFNTESVARAILDCPVPVISAVGHEVDVTISDLVADHRSPTPTAAGEEAAPELSELEDQLQTLGERIDRAYQAFLDRKHDRVRNLAEKPVMADLEGLLQPFRDTLERLSERLRVNYERFVTQKRNILNQQSSKLQSLSPENVLERGYGLIRKDNRPVTSVKDVSEDDKLLVQWSDGSADVIVEATSEE